jgi:integrase
MPTLFQKDGYWWINYRLNGERRRQSTGTKNRKLADIKLSELEVSLFKGVPPQKKKDIPTTSLPAFFRRFIDYAKSSYAPDHLQSDLSRIRILQDFFARKGIIDLQSINPGVFEEFQTNVLNGRKPKTRKNYITLLKTMLNYAVKWGVIDKNPLAGVRAPKIVKTFHFFKKDEVEKLINKAEEPLKTAIIILVNTGLRRNELFHLRWRDIDLKAKKLRVWPYEGFTPKGKRPRTIPLNKGALAAFKALHKSSDGSEYAFRPFNSMFGVYERFNALLLKQGVKGTLHDLRHTFASHLAMSGVPIPVISELLGHSDIATTMIYAHLSPEQHQVAVEKLDF